MTRSQQADQPTDPLIPTATHNAPTQSRGGLARDGTHFWPADFGRKELLCLDPGSLTLQRRFPSQGKLHPRAA